MRNTLDANLLAHFVASSLINQFTAVNLTVDADGLVDSQ